MTDNYKQLIDGAWSDAANGGTWNVMNPASEEVIRAVPFGGREDCRAAIEAASRAFPAWARMTPYQRGSILSRTAQLLRERADEIGRLTVMESGKPFVQGRGECLVAADLFEWFAEEGKRAYGRTIPLLGKPFEQVGRHQAFAASLDKRLAALHHCDATDIVGPLAQ